MNPQTDRTIYVIRNKRRQFLSATGMWTVHFRRARIYTRSDYARNSLPFVRVKYSDDTCYIASCTVVLND